MAPISRKEKIDLLLEQLSSELRGIAGIAGVLKQTDDEPWCFAGEGIENSAGNCFEVIGELLKMNAESADE